MRFIFKLLVTTTVLPLAIVLSPAAAEQDLSLRRAIPEHFEKSNRQKAPAPPMGWEEPRRPGEGVVYRFAEPIADLDPIIGRIDRLSYLCRAGQFGQIIPLRLRAVDGGGKTFGLVFGSGGERSNLHDPSHAAREDQIYLIDGQDTARCTVWAGLLRPVRQLAGLTRAGLPQQ